MKPIYNIINFESDELKSTLLNKFDFNFSLISKEELLNNNVDSLVFLNIELLTPEITDYLNNQNLFVILYSNSPTVIDNQLICPFFHLNLNDKTKFSQYHKQIHNFNELLKVKLSNKELHNMAFIDSLTGVLNHRSFWIKLDEEISRAKRHQRKFSLVMCDIINFKKINNVHGHQKGNVILTQVAQMMELNKRATDSVARYGGDEFFIILSETSLTETLTIIKRLKSKLSNLLNIKIRTATVEYPKDGLTATELVYNCDQKLIKKK